MKASSRIVFRLATLLLAVVLCAECNWLLLAQIFRPVIDRLPTNAAAAAALVSQRDAATRAASVGAFRGELWGEVAFTCADLFFDKAPPSAAGPSRALQDCRQGVERALRQAPAQPGVWLLRAGLALRYPSLGFKAEEALKMSYYTGPSEQDLVPLRLRIAANSDAFHDVETRQLMRRDLRLLVARHATAAIGQAYDAASPEVKRFIEQTVGDIDPSALDRLRNRAKHSQSIPAENGGPASRHATGDGNEWPKNQ
jgi:hypothetical protein